MTLPFKFVSADSHIAEPPDLWTTRIDKEFRDRAPHMVRRDKGDAYVIDGESNSASLVGLLATKPKYADPGDALRLGRAVGRRARRGVRPGRPRGGTRP